MYFFIEILLLSILNLEFHYLLHFIVLHINETNILNLSRNAKKIESHKIN